MQIITGHFEGTGAVLYLQLGSIPHQIRIYNLGGATPDEMIWDEVMACDILTTEGLVRTGNGGAVVDNVFGAGISPYYGGDLLTTTNQSDTTYGGGVYIERDDKDYRQVTNAAAGISGDAATEDITTWTLDTAATPTGSFNGDVTGAYIGPGSEIRIQSSDRKHVYKAYIQTLTAGQGVTANEVRLSWAVPSGTVEFIGGMYGYKPSAIGAVTMPGMVITMVTPINVNAEHHSFVAICPG